MRSRQLGQNFLRNKRTARRLVHLAGGEPQLLCVDLGAGTGSVTEAALAIRTGSILAVEYDQRLVAQLKARYADEPRVMVRSADLLAAPLPDEPFIIAANPPFNTSTKLVRRWMLAPTFVSGALIVEAPFAGRVSGSYGATKLSLSLAPFLQLDVGVAVKSAEFTPAPNVATVILTSSRRPTPDVARGDAPAYWAFVNFLFERGSRTVGRGASAVGEVGVLRAGVGAAGSRRRRRLGDRSCSPNWCRRTSRRLVGSRTFEERLPVGRRSRDLFGSVDRSGGSAV
jgi:16S rRNA A1518/A1519 N6-dimethyltransferase RsmA/KsgA/DIM1 with predicted DNA glycosylase/AP lyase activity